MKQEAKKYITIFKEKKATWIAIKAA